LSFLFIRANQSLVDTSDPGAFRALKVLAHCLSFGRSHGRLCHLEPTGYLLFTYLSASSRDFNQGKVNTSGCFCLSKCLVNRMQLWAVKTM